MEPLSIESPTSPTADPLGWMTDPSDAPAVSEAPERSDTEEEGVRPWSWPVRVLFRFTFLYLVLYNLPFPFGRLSLQPLGELPIPGAAAVAAAWSAASRWIAGQWTALGHTVAEFANTHVLQREAPLQTRMTGSGDGLYHWVLAGILVVVAFLGTVVWTLLARRRRAHRHAHSLLRVYLRYSLATWLLIYGFAKVTQFPLPYDQRMFTEYGDMSPMGLLWKFMGYSYPYTLLTGFAEATAGLLLLWRRTTPLGVLLATACMLNVTALNFCYDVPVKLFSAHLLLMAVVLMLPEARRIAAVLLSYRGVPSRVRVHRPAWVRWPLRVIKYLLIACFLFLQVRGTYRAWNVRTAEEPALAGIWRVLEFERDGTVVPPFTDPSRWRHVVIRPGLASGNTGERSVAVAVRLTDEGTVPYYRSGVDPGAHRLVLRAFVGPQDSTPPDWPTEAELGYEQTGPDALVLSGDYAGAALRVTLERLEPGDFPLLERPFHWVQEYPFNR